MAVILTGKPVADALSADTGRRAGALRQRGVSPRLVILRCGENEADGAYIRGAVKRGALCGVEVELRALPADATAADVREAIREINGDGSVHGCLLLRPLPPHLRAEEDGICACLDPRKDVDGMTPASAAGVYTGHGQGFGRSAVVGRPAAMLLLREDAAVTVCHSRTPDTAALTRQADIIITAAGVRSSLTAAHVRPGQTVVDVSVNGDGSALCGDADFAAVEPVVDAITPVPGGVGAVTSSVLMAHTVRAAELLTGEGRL